MRVEYASEGSSNVPFMKTSHIDSIGLDDAAPHISPRYAPAQNVDTARDPEMRKVAVPPHRMTPLKNAWPHLFPPLVDHLKLQVRMNIKAKTVELRTSKHTKDVGALQKGEDFLKAFTL